MITADLSAAFARSRVLVVGDVMLDRYWHGDTSRISPEAPVPVVRVHTETERAGGAGNVALNLRALGVQTALMGLVGHDAAAGALRKKLAEAGVQDELLALAQFSTIVKLRVLAQHQQLIRLDFENAASEQQGQSVDHPLAGLPTADLLPAFQKALAGAEVVVLSDYAKGALTQCAALIAAARATGRVVVVDPKGSDFTPYRGATIITPNHKEFTAVAGHCADDAELVSKAQKLLADLALEAVLITRGEHGMSLIRAHAAALHLPAQARDVYDVTGAGDTVCAVLAAALAAGQEWTQAVRMANAAAGVVVGKLGAASVSPAELTQAMQAGSSPHDGVLNENELLERVAQARRQGQRIVMTNGCFDILHAGHVQYLTQARARGDWLIVAVNDDGSVKRLKGAPRPLNPLADRMQVLAALACVDWVVPFSEDTPARLISQVLPDVLVKGGDYTADQVAGADAVRAHGGEVVIVDFIPGHSTTHLIQRAGGAT